MSERNATVQYVAYYLTLFGSYIKPKNRKEKQKQICLEKCSVVAWVRRNAADAFKKMYVVFPSVGSQ